jgi:hypothetical protein
MVCLTSEPPNVLRISRAATVDREGNRADSSNQNRPDLARRVAASDCMRGLGSPSAITLRMETNNSYQEPHTFVVCTAFYTTLKHYLSVSVCGYS